MDENHDQLELLPELLEGLEQEIARQKEQKAIEARKRARERARERRKEIRQMEEAHKQLKAFLNKVQHMPIMPIIPDNGR